MPNIKIIGLTVVILLVLACGAYWKIWNTAYDAGKNEYLAEYGEALKEEQRKNSKRLSQIIAERNLSREKVIKLNEIISNPTPQAPTVIEIIKYQPSTKCTFDDEFKRLLNQSWKDGITPNTETN